jgi:hypothetical protein
MEACHGGFPTPLFKNLFSWFGVLLKISLANWQEQLFSAK